MAYPSDKWHKRFTAMAELVATWSKDPNCQVGCVLVSPDKRQFSVGYNGFPKGIQDNKVRLNNKEWKNELMVHAELNAILNASCNLTCWTLYTTKPPCVNCTKAIIQVGIETIVIPQLDTKSDWYEQHIDAISLLDESGLVVEFY